MEPLLAVGIVASVFVGFNIGGSSTGIAWGPPVGAGVIKKTTAGALMTIFVFFGGWTVGRNVMGTLSEGIITLEGGIPLAGGVAILFFIGLGILVANVFGVPVPTSMTTVGAIAGLGLATGTLNHEEMTRIITWWFVTPVIGFWIGGMIGRYVYPTVNRRVTIKTTEGPLLVLDRTGNVPRPAFGPNTTSTEVVSTVVVFVIGCYMAFSAGASNVPNAAAPLVSAGDGLPDDVAIVLATLAIGLGGFTIARRTMESVGSELSDIPLLAALFVMVTSSTITTLLSWIGIPISLVMSTVMTIVGIGWGRATRPVTVREAVSRAADNHEIVTGAITVEATGTESAPIGEAESAVVLDAGELFNPRAVIKYVSMWIIGPSLSTGLAYGFFVLVPGVV